MTSWGSNCLCKALLSDVKERRSRWQRNTNQLALNQTHHIIEEETPPMLVNMSFSCRKMFEKHNLGTGNWVWLIYNMRLALAAHGKYVKYSMSCSDEDIVNVRRELVIPWILKGFNERDLLSKSINETDESLLRRACHGLQETPLWHMIPDMRHDLAGMAKDLVGTPEWHQSNHSIKSSTNSPPTKYEDIELDETTWHFRCGDLLYSKHPGYAWHKFHLHASHIHNDTRSIGILTEPFTIHRIEGYSDNKRLNFDVLNKAAASCEQLAHKLVEYLQQRFPRARIRIRNNANESVALAYSRMIMARQTIVGDVSTFGAYAALASWGQAVMVAPDFRHAPGRWLLDWEKEERSNGRGTDDSNVTLVHDSNSLHLKDFNDIWWLEEGGKDALIQWLTNDTLEDIP